METPENCIRRKPVYEFPKKEYNEEDMLRFQKEACKWAAAEQAALCPQAHRGPLRSIREGAMKYGLHESYFSDPDNPDLVYYRMWWNKSSNLAYAVLTNGRALREESQDLFDQYIRNGIYAYLRQVQPAVCKVIFGEDRD